MSAAQPAPASAAPVDRAVARIIRPLNGRVGAGLQSLVIEPAELVVTRPRGRNYTENSQLHAMLPV
ncbi:hypothetical protein GCM10009624_27720 [Gordonia sinesedis]